MTRLQFEEIFPKEYEIIRQMEEDDQGLDFIFVRLEGTSAGEILTETKKAISESGKYSPTDDIVAKAYEKVKSAVHKNRSFVYSAYDIVRYKATNPVYITHMKVKVNDLHNRIVFVIVLRPDEMTNRDHAALTYMLQWMQDEYVGGIDLSDVSNLLVRKMIDTKSIQAVANPNVVTVIEKFSDRNFEALTIENDGKVAYNDYIKVLNFEMLNCGTLWCLVDGFDNPGSYYRKAFNFIGGFTAPETWYSNNPEEADLIEEFDLDDEEYRIEVFGYLWSLIDGNLKNAVIKLPTGDGDNIYLINSAYGENHEELIAALNDYSDFEHPVYEADSYYGE